MRVETDGEKETGDLVRPGIEFRRGIDENDGVQKTGKSLLNFTLE